jgi:hypothetical protein
MLSGLDSRPNAEQRNSLGLIKFPNFRYDEETN